MTNVNVVGCNPMVVMLANKLANVSMRSVIANVTIDTDFDVVVVYILFLMYPSLFVYFHLFSLWDFVGCNDITLCFLSV